MVDATADALKARGAYARQFREYAAALEAQVNEPPAAGPSEPADYLGAVMEGRARDLVVPPTLTPVDLSARAASIAARAAAQRADAYADHEACRRRRFMEACLYQAVADLLDGGSGEAGCHDPFDPASSAGGSCPTGSAQPPSATSGPRPCPAVQDPTGNGP